MRNARQMLSELIRYLGNVHVAGSQPDIFLLSTPRSGSTWLMEAIAAEPGIRACNEPLNLRKPEIVRSLGIENWSELESEAALSRVERYLRRMRRNSWGHSFRTPRPLQRGYRPVSRRVVFKELFGFETRVRWLRETFGARIVCLVRHPIPVSLSREELPRLTAMLGSAHSAWMNPEQRAFAKRIMASGDRLELAQLDWCLQNRPLQDAVSDVDLFLTYEQLVLQPDVVIERLATTLGLHDLAAVRASFGRLSGSVAKSNASSRAVLEVRDSNAFALLSKWRATVSEIEEQRAMRVVRALGIDIYRARSFIPDRRYWLGDQYPVLVAPPYQRTHAPSA